MSRYPRGVVAGQLPLYDDHTTEMVLGWARSPGLVLVHPADQLYRRQPSGDRADAMGLHYNETAHLLISLGRLVLGDRTRITDADGETRIATTVDLPADPVPSATPTGDGPVRLLVDVVRPGLGLVTAADGTFSGSIVRQDGTYLVETEHGEVIGRASSYRNGAVRLARHHDRRPGPVEIEHEHEVRR